MLVSPLSVLAGFIRLITPPRSCGLIKPIKPWTQARQSYCDVALGSLGLRWWVVVGVRVVLALPRSATGAAAVGASSRAPGCGC